MTNRRSFVNSLYFIVILSSLLVNVATYFVLRSPSFGDDPTGLKSDAFFTTLIQWLLFTIIPLVGYAVYGRINKKDKICIYEDFGFNVFSPKILLQSLLIFLFMGPLTLLVIVINHSIILEPLGYVTYPNDEKLVTVGHLLASLFLTAVSPAFGEEILNRGLMYSAYKKRPVEFVLKSAFLFALMHQNIRQFAYTFLFGILIGCTMLYTRSFWAGVIIHFLNNGLQVLYRFADDTQFSSLKWLLVLQERMSIVPNLLGVLLFIMRIVGCLLGVIGVISWMKHCAKKKQTYNKINFDKYERGSWVKDIPYFLSIALGIVMTVMSLAWRSVVL